MSEPIFYQRISTAAPRDYQPPSDLRQRILQLLEDNNGVHAPEPTGTLRAVGYTRVSSVMQLDGTSLEDQDQRITAYITEQGWQLQELITDPAQSGRNGKRPGFLRLQRLVREGRVQVVVVDRIDRLARDLGVFLAFLALLRSTKVQLISLREGIDYRKPWGKLVLYILGALAEFYSNNLAQEIRTKRLMDAANGKLAPTFRYGYCIGNCSTCTDPNGPEYCPNIGGPEQRGPYFRMAHPVESVAVGLMFDWYATSNCSYAEIAQRLNQDVFTLPDDTEIRFRTKGRPGLTPPGRFDADAVREILSNPIYTGAVTYAGSLQDGTKIRKPREVFPGRGLHPALVDALTFLRVQQIRKNRYARPDSAGSPAQAFPLSRLLLCAHRHSPVRSQSATGHRYYMDRICQTKHSEKHQPNVRAETVETQVRAVVGQLQLPAPWLRRTLAYLLYDEGESALLQDRLALQQRLEAETYLLRQGLISTAEFQRRRAQIVTALATLEPAATPACQEALALLHNLSALLAALEPEEENALYRAMFTSIIVDQQQLVGFETFAPFLELHPRFTLPGTHVPTLGPHPIP